MQDTIKSNAINYGLYLGGLLSLYTVLGYALNLELLVNFWMTLLILPLVIIGFGIVSTAKANSLLNGFLNFKQTFSSYFITVAIGLMISTVLSIIIFNFIDPDAAIEIKEILVEKLVNMMEGFGAPPEKIAEEVEKIENQDTFALGIQLKSLAQSLVVFAIIGLLVAAVMKKTNPDAE
jgi:hypothetical protein